MGRKADGDLLLDARAIDERLVFARLKGSITGEFDTRSSQGQSRKLGSPL